MDENSGRRRRTACDQFSDPYLVQSGTGLRLYQCDDHRRCVDLAASGSDGCSFFESGDAGDERPRPGSHDPEHPEYALEALQIFVSGFLLKPANEADVRNVLENLRYPAEDVPAGVKVQCFGNFEVFVGGRPLSFKRSKSKELLAYLVDRNGATCTNGEMLAVLWEDKPDTASLHSHLRNLIFDLSHTLEDAGVRGLLVRGRSTLAIDTSKVECDYYNFLRGDRSTISSYRGEYMTQYSWAEVTRSALRQQAAASQKGGLPSYYVPPTGF